MDLNNLREAIRREPFESFVIRLADGRSFDVNHPEFLAIGRRAVLIDKDDSCIWLEPLLVVSVEWPVGGAKRKGGNGSPKKHRPDS